MSTWSFSAVRMVAYKHTSSAVWVSSIWDAPIVIEMDTDNLKVHCLSNEVSPCEMGPLVKLWKWLSEQSVTGWPSHND